MLKAILATIFGAFIGALVGLDLQIRFHLGIGAWSFSGLVGAVVGFLTFKPAEVLVALKKAWRVVMVDQWYLPGYSAKYRKLWKHRAMWVGLSGFGATLTFLSFFLLFHVIKFHQVLTWGVAWGVIFISAMIGIMLFFMQLFEKDMVYEEALPELVATNRRRLWRYFNPIAFCVWVVVGVGFGVLCVVWILSKIPEIVMETIKYSATHERFTVSVSAGAGALCGFFFAQSNTIFGLLCGAVFGVFFLLVSKILSACLVRQEG